jgi:hypothetical protein
VIQNGSGNTATANEIITVSPPPPPTAVDDIYTSTGGSRVTLTPLVGDSTGTTIRSIGGVDLTPGILQTITLT